MAETYCGKCCMDCPDRETMTCPGCKAGPGRSWAGACEIARCVQGKGHESCDTCGFRTNCGTCRGRERMPEYRRKKAEAEAQQRAEIAQKAPVLGKWLWILFWLIIPGTLASLMTNNTVVEIAPGLRLPGQILDMVVSVAYGLILLRLSDQEARYKTAGICALILGGDNLISMLIPPAEMGITLLLALGVLIIGLVSEYQECMGHAAVLSGVDNEQSEKWELLWKWYIGMTCTVFGSIFLMIIGPVLGLIAFVLSAIGMLVVSIAKLVCLYRTAKIFREYAQNGI